MEAGPRRRRCYYRLRFDSCETYILDESERRAINEHVVAISDFGKAQLQLLEQGFLSPHGPTISAFRTLGNGGGHADHAHKPFRSVRPKGLLAALRCATASSVERLCKGSAVYCCCMRLTACRAAFALGVLGILELPVHTAKPKKPASEALFGSRTPIPGALRGVVYRLPRDTGALPNFATFKPVGTVYTTRLDYELQEYGEEWFGIEYTGRFYVSLPGDYDFQLTVDDGAAVIIDGKRIIHIDGVHPVRTEQGRARLTVGWHDIRVPYFQGPVPYIALVLQVAPPKGKRRVFDVTAFQPAPEAMPDDQRPTLRRK